MVDGSLGEVLGDAEVVGALARSGRAVSFSAAIAAASAADVDEIDAARGREYALLSVLLAHAPDQSLLKRLADLSGDPTPLGVAHGALAQAARRTNAEQVEREYFRLFIGLGRGELLPYGPIEILPGARALHFAEQAFEGMKAYRVGRPAANLFRAVDNYAKFGTGNGGFWEDRGYEWYGGI